jgi:hypothetical protein
MIKIEFDSQKAVSQETIETLLKINDNSALLK